MAYFPRDAFAPGALLSWPLASTRSFADFLVLLQQAQLNLLLTWQQSVVAMNQEIWDAWASRWAGGVPIDG